MNVAAGGLRHTSPGTWVKTESQCNLLRRSSHAVVCTCIRSLSRRSRAGATSLDDHGMHYCEYILGAFRDTDGLEQIPCKGRGRRKRPPNRRPCTRERRAVRKAPAKITSCVAVATDAEGTSACYVISEGMTEHTHKAITHEGADQDRIDAVARDATATGARDQRDRDRAPTQGEHTSRCEPRFRNPGAG